MPGLGMCVFTAVATCLQLNYLLADELNIDTQDIDEGSRLSVKGVLATIAAASAR